MIAALISLPWEIKVIFEGCWQFLTQVLFGIMLKYLFVLSFFLLYVKTVDVTSDEKWDNFKVKWTLPGQGGFIDQPKKQSDAESKNWKQVLNSFRGCSSRKK